MEEVAERIRVRKEFLEALEDMNVKLLPGKAYALAFLRSYARELGIEEKAIVDQFQDECALTREDANKPDPHPDLQAPPASAPGRAAAALCVIAAVFVGWRAFESQHGPGRGSTASSASPAAEATPGATPASTSRCRAVWSRSGPSRRAGWKRGARTAPCSSPAPCSRAMFTARTPARAGPSTPATAAPFELYVNGASAGLLGTAGMPVLGRSIDEIQPLTQAEVASPAQLSRSAEGC